MIRDIVATLKIILRQRGYTYADIAMKLNLSESSIKRYFARCDFSLKRLQQICDLIGLDLNELVHQATENQRNINQLSEEQEKQLVQNVKLLLIAFLLLNHFSYKQILTQYAIEAHEGVQLLTKLDHLGIIQLLPENKIRIRLSRNFNWLKNGPIQQFFEEKVQSEFFKSRFDQAGELRMVLNGMLSTHSLEIINQRFQRMALEFESLVKDERKLNLNDRMSITAVIAVRPWHLGVFEQFRRN
ncbi:Cro/C1-type HTH DNA-binding domain-containing protein [Nitrosomonas cryotolerans]|uniref:Helix-turn-helix domain-containing protein n=1 Tax=Nitrosomonas cryotolerans ATCC 49181 TaxID=1131553 RepID=A0A1N6IT32_9PROT|nr:helix-turn-helix domain-containing protein [Nitrosomonas cryotolerans]SFP33039.1 Cro/C1-type HTH DNA-binding domain-containing protein [Nitrosomonas cryotolerans]SIO35124.1 Helix-turn-helix domain-containing protein [Nitrosomonas cryotolerans ATCC 49181]